MERSHDVKKKPAISPNFGAYIIAVIFVGVLLTVLESQVSKKSALYLFILIILGMVLSDQFILIKFAGLINRIRSSYNAAS